MKFRELIAIASTCAGVALVFISPAFSQQNPIKLGKNKCCRPAQPTGPVGVPCDRPCQPPAGLVCGGGGAVVGSWFNGDCLAKPDHLCGKFNAQYKNPLVVCRVLQCTLPPNLPGEKCGWVKVGDDVTMANVQDCQGSACP